MLGATVRFEDLKPVFLGVDRVHDVIVSNPFQLADILEDRWRIADDIDVDIDGLELRLRDPKAFVIANVFVVSLIDLLSHV